MVRPCIALTRFVGPLIQQGVGWPHPTPSHPHKANPSARIAVARFNPARRYLGSCRNRKPATRAGSQGALRHCFVLSEHRVCTIPGQRLVPGPAITQASRGLPLDTTRRRQLMAGLSPLAAHARVFVFKWWRRGSPRSWPRAAPQCPRPAGQSRESRQRCPS